MGGGAQALTFGLLQQRGDAVRVHGRRAQLHQRQEEGLQRGVQGLQQSEAQAQALDGHVCRDEGGQAQDPGLRTDSGGPCPWGVGRWGAAAPGPGHFRGTGRTPREILFPGPTDAVREWPLVCLSPGQAEAVGRPWLLGNPRASSAYLQGHARAVIDAIFNFKFETDF